MLYKRQLDKKAIYCSCYFAVFCLSFEPNVMEGALSNRLSWFQNEHLVKIPLRVFCVKRDRCLFVLRDPLLKNNLKAVNRERYAYRDVRPQIYFPISSKKKPVRRATEGEATYL